MNSRPLFGLRPAMALLALALSLAACAHNPNEDLAAGGPGAAGIAAPGSVQEFNTAIGDRVFFDSDFSELSPHGHRDARQTGRMAQPIRQLRLHRRGPCGRTRHARIQFRPWPAPRRNRESLPDRQGRAGAAHEDHFLRQGASGRGLRRHFLLVAESARGHGAQRSARALKPLRLGRAALPPKFWPSLPTMLGGRALQRRGMSRELGMFD